MCDVLQTKVKKKEDNRRHLTKFDKADDLEAIALSLIINLLNEK